MEEMKRGGGALGATKVGFGGWGSLLIGLIAGAAAFWLTTT